MNTFYIARHGEHNISEAYPHDYVGVFTFVDGAVKSFEEYTGYETYHEQ